MHSEETVLQSASPCKVISISDFEGSRKDRIEEWLKQETGWQLKELPIFWDLE